MHTPDVGSAAGREASPGGRTTRLDVAVLIAILLLGTVNLAQPLGWDQAIFTIAARRLHEGAQLYRDVWDVKQPGLFVFYLLGGSAFGFSEVGIHAFELLYWLAFSFLLQRSLKRDFPQPWAASLAPLLVVGLYYAVSGDWHLTQAEGLAGFPMFFALTLAARAGEDGRSPVRALALSGLCGGLVLFLKLLFLPILAVFWLLALARAWPRHGAAATLAGAGAIAAGAALPFAIAAAYFAAHGTLGLAWWTNIVYPLQLSPPHPRFRSGMLMEGLGWFGTNWAVPLGLAAFGVVATLGRARDRLMPSLLGWFGVGFAVILVQRLSWWEYHYLLLMVPVGVLAARGLGLLSQRLTDPADRTGRRTALALGVALTLAFAPALGTAGLKAVYFAHDGFARNAAAQRYHGIRMSRGSAYAKILADIGLLSAPGARPGPIYVAGNPLYHWLSGRDSAIPRFGGVLTTYASAADWQEITRGLSAARPPYIFVDRVYLEELRGMPERSAPFLALLEGRYRMVQQSRMGAWWELGEGAAPRAPAVAVPEPPAAEEAR